MGSYYLSVYHFPLLRSESIAGFQLNLAEAQMPQR